MKRGCTAISIALGIVLAVVSSAIGETSFSVMTWNVQGYPELTTTARTWFTRSLEEYEPTILCLQEIANADRVNAFLDTEYVVSSAFVESASDLDNAIFCDASFMLWDVPDPDGFSYPAQLAVLLIDGCPYYILTVQLDGQDATQRADERERLGEVIGNLLMGSQYVILAGDLHTTGGAGDTIEGLAADLGLVWLEPDNYCCVGTTYPGERYDHILVSPVISESWTIVTTIIEFDGLTTARESSDHRPVLAVFSPIVIPTKVSPFPEREREPEEPE